MYLKELRLHGFKSFADPTRLDLQRGVTAIVGPNGCGKSNIADALRWVLGEQSAKSLRAGGMQDVIFQGTSNRKPVNLCEVSLVFTDCEDSLGTAHHEVEVTRRVIRDGGSEYLLNGKPCRLKDIHNLFLDTGVGQVSYSFMLQGQIDQVLSSNPSERRAIFEEAAGISRYKAQRREALNKLSQVDANLSRVTDVMEEVARQTGSLKRQASKALRYQRIHHRLSHLDLAHNGFRFGELNTESEANRRKKDVLAEQMEKLNQELDASESSLTSKRDEALGLRQRLEEAQKQVYELRSEKENASNRSEMASLRKEDIGRRISEIKDELARLSEEEELIAGKLAGETKLKQEQLDMFGNSDEEFQKRSADLAELQKQLNGSETDLSRLKQGLVAKENAVSRLRSNCSGLELDLTTYQVRHANLMEELQTLKNDKEVLQQDLATLERTRETREKDKEKQVAKLEELKTKRQELTHAFRDLQVAIQEAERRRASLQAQVTVLEGLQAKFEGFSEGAKAILQGKLETVAPEGSFTVFLKQLKVGEGFTSAVEFLLGAASDGILLRDPKVLRPLAQSLIEKRIGRASLLAKPAGSSAFPSIADKLPGSIIPAGSVVSSADADVQAFLDTFLAGCYIADDLDSFLNYWEANPDFPFFLAVTRNNEVIDARGVVLAGSTSAKKENSSFLSRQNQLKAFAKDLSALEDEHERRRLEAEQIQGKLDAAEKRIDEQTQLLSETGTELTTLSTQKQGIEQTLQGKARLHETKSADLEKLESHKDESTSRLEKARKELEETEADIEAWKKQIGEAEESVASLRKERETKREAFDEVRFDVSQKRQRLELLDRGLNDLQQRSKETQETRIKRLEEVEQLKKSISSLEKESGEHVQAEKEIQKRLDMVREALEKDRLVLKEVEQKIAVVEEGFAPKREAQRNMAAELNKTEVALARQESRLQFIAEECQRDYEREAAEIDWKLELWKAGESLPERIRVDIEETTPEEMESLQERPDPTDEERASLEPVDWDEVEGEISSLRSRIQSMGPVNLVAIEEYKELKERHEFLKTQSEDLWKSKEQLLEAIDEINTTSQSMFAETFAKIRENFHYTFETLFGGGRADLTLVDAEDVLESGIDITAQPPGTRLRNLGLLSGGQKTMTAVALLFAIYMVKPSPFCVLDEIDAPLDDANIGRFTGMLEGFLEFSQFLIITHNKRTISVADTIYGATMQEKGVSRLVSMRFNKSTGKAELHEKEEDS
ncbi:chromosome segregation protein SMC [Puniceicoccales bacterium CK1056]|uniref:Chromosome partition protein Smc n=1 Tax=Oceanipulchritudo coccoides TaxID=2706888 RepID=A0A6B2M424_9BACT|nr:chromosome segregation protein SMC [Oceanipulchritudo coccoides]NDV62979.1 chromosome segregation protein SMC [Oceanipulchritudo coccoides]